MRALAGRPARYEGGTWELSFLQGQVIPQNFDSSLPASICLSSSRTPTPGKSTSVAASVYLKEPTKLATTAVQAPHVKKCVVLEETGCSASTKSSNPKAHSCRRRFTIAPLRPMVANSLCSLRTSNIARRAENDMRKTVCKVGCESPVKQEQNILPGQAPDRAEGSLSPPGETAASAAA